MAGLGGRYDPRSPASSAALTPILREMDPRGPVARVEVPFAHGTLGATVGAGETPGTDPTGRWTVLLSGPPHNLRGLRTEIAARGHAGEDASAAEVVAGIFAEVGFEGGLARLEGDAAVVAWDARDEVLWLARDRVGLHPVHWAHVDEGIAWASDAAALACAPDRAPAVDPVAVARLAVFGVLPPPRAILAGAEKLAPGTWLRADAAGVRTHRWWEPQRSPEGAGGAEIRWARSLSMALSLAVRQRLGGDLAVACGGGAFSRAVGAVADIDRRDPLPRLRFGEGGDVELRPDDLGATLDEMAGTLGEPPGTPAALGWWLLARAAWERGHDGLLTGIGGVAGFVAPGRSRPRRLAARLGLPLPSPATPTRDGLDVPPDEPGWEDVDAALGGPVDPDRAFGALHRRLLLPERDLAAAERACAAFGLRLAAPLADPRLLDLAASVPIEHHRRGGRPRHLFLVAVAGHLPTPPDPAPPLPFPLAAWLRGPCAPLLADLADRTADLAEPSHTRALVAGHVAGRFDAAQRLWALLVVERWRRRLNPSASRPSWADSRPPIK